jgi:membrane associated rhomboid family serine protease
MGIYDREYYRKEGPSFLYSIGMQGQVIKWLVAINVALFVAQMLTPPLTRTSFGMVTDLLVLDTARVMHGEVWRLLTYAFLHDTHTVWHIVFNMLFLWWFGNDIETLYGPREFLAIYLMSALAGGVVFEGLWLVSGDGRTAGWLLGGQPHSIYCLGASGAVTAVLVLCACHFPGRIILLFFVLPVPIWLFVIFQIAQDAFVFVGGIKTSTAVAVHLAGAGFAFAYYKAHWHLLSLLPNLRAWRRARARPKLRVFHGESEPSEHVMAGAPPASADMDEQLEAKLDAVLEKVARFGKESLTESEKQILQRASDMYRRRRT